MQPDTPGSVTSGGSWAERFILATPVLQGPSVVAVSAAEASQPLPANGAAPLQTAPQQQQPLPGLALVCATLIISSRPACPQG